MWCHQLKQLYYQIERCIKISCLDKQVYRGLRSSGMLNDCATMRPSWRLFKVLGWYQNCWCWIFPIEVSKSKDVFAFAVSIISNRLGDGDVHSTALLEACRKIFLMNEWSLSHFDFSFFASTSMIARELDAVGSDGGCGVLRFVAGRREMMNSSYQVLTEGDATW